MMTAHRRLALALALLLSVCTVSATTVCYANHKYRFGPHRMQEIVEEASKAMRASANSVIAKNWGAQNVCWVDRRTPMDDFYCKMAFSENSGLKAGEYYGNLPVGLVLDPPIQKHLSNIWGAPNVNGHVYNTREIQEIWVIDEWRYPGKKFINKVTETFGYESLSGTCWKTPTKIAYLNGVTTTAEGAKNSLNAIRAEIGNEFNGAKLHYRLLYNQTSCRDGFATSCLGDFAETFQQRQQQLDEALQNRWEIFWDLLSGRERKPESTSANLFSSFGSLLGNLQASLINSVLELSTSLANRKTVESDLHEHLQTLGRGGSANESTVIVAHSQGNLFADAITKSYPKYARSDAGNEYPNISFIHVAPPTTRLFGPYVLANIDQVIGSLGISMPNSTPGANVIMPYSLHDPLGHSFLETYWDRSRPAFGYVRSSILTELSNK